MEGQTEIDLGFSKVLVRKAGDVFAKRHPTVRRIIGLIYWLFPVVVMLVGLVFSLFVPAFRNSLSHWPKDDYFWLLFVIQVLLAATWQVFDLFWCFSRETTSRSLQWNCAVSILLAIVFSIAFGFLLSGPGIPWLYLAPGIPWGFIVPFALSVLDALASSWASLNNATQKPFMTPKGST